MTTTETLHDVLEEILLAHRTQCEKALDFYERLLAKVPTDEHWKHKKESSFYDTLGDVIPPDPLLQTDISRTIIATIDEYLEAFEYFDDSQWQAFALGLGLRWIPFNYWGRDELEGYIAKLDKALGFYQELSDSVPEEELWKYKRKVPWEHFPEVGTDDVRYPAETIQQFRQLSNAILQTLS